MLRAENMPFDNGCYIVGRWVQCVEQYLFIFKHVTGDFLDVLSALVLWCFENGGGELAYIEGKVPLRYGITGAFPVRGNAVSGCFTTGVLRPFST